MELSTNIVLPYKQVKLSLFDFLAYLFLFTNDARQDLVRSDCTDGLSDWMDERFIFIDNTFKNLYLVFYVFRLLCVMSRSL